MSRRLASTNALRAAPIAALLLAGFAATLYFAFPAPHPPKVASGVWLALVVPVDEANPFGGQVRAINTATGEEVDLREPGDWVALSWSPDGRYLYATQLIGLGSDDESDFSIRPTIFDVPRHRVVASAVWPWDDCIGGADRASWSPDGSGVALPGQSCAAVFQVGGQFDLVMLNGTATGASGGLPAWAPDSSRYIYRAGSRETVIVDRDASTGSLISWPAAVTGASAWQLDYFIWTAPATLRVYVRTYPDPRDDNDQDAEPLRYWTIEGTFVDGRIAWDSPQESDPSTYFPPFPDDAPLREGHGRNDPVPYRTMLSDDLQFVAAVPFMRSFQPLEDPVFVTIIDGVRFAYPLGSNFLAATAFEYAGRWDMVRVD
ncbi:MAG: hypothetical protein R3B97_03240 [Dehalococcoidia bacterium]|nr:hypothetical protein [Dehalococcoidia bacterium]MCB9485045.1 hypothetical protein [Thermoflexaceae bacterium]